jgi:hypothetical protein
VHVFAPVHTSLHRFAPVCTSLHVFARLWRSLTRGVRGSCPRISLVRHLGGSRLQRAPCSCHRRRRDRGCEAERGWLESTRRLEANATSCNECNVCSDMPHRRRITRPRRLDPADKDQSPPRRVMRRGGIPGAARILPHGAPRRAGATPLEPTVSESGERVHGCRCREGTGTDYS